MDEVIGKSEKNKGRGGLSQKAQPVKTLATKPDYPSLVPRAYTVELIPTNCPLTCTHCVDCDAHSLNREI